MHLVYNQAIVDTLRFFPSGKEEVHSTGSSQPLHPGPHWEPISKYSLLSEEGGTSREYSTLRVIVIKFCLNLFRRILESGKYG